MKLKIEKKFVDKNTGELYRVGDVVEFSKARGDELLADTRNLVSLAETIDEQPKPTKATKATKKK